MLLADLSKQLRPRPLYLPRGLEPPGTPTNVGTGPRPLLRAHPGTRPALRITSRFPQPCCRSISAGGGDVADGVLSRLTDCRCPHPAKIASAAGLSAAGHCRANPAYV